MNRMTTKVTSNHYIASQDLDRADIINYLGKLEDRIEQGELVEPDDFEQKTVRDVLAQVCKYLDATLIGTGARARILHSIQHGIALDYNLDIEEILK